MNEQIKFYQNNPCIIIRDINEDFAEVSISHHYAGDMELTGQCEGCCFGDSDNKLSCTCDEHSWIIEAVQEEENKLIVVVEKRLLTDHPVEFLELISIKSQVQRELESLAKTKELHEEWQTSVRGLKDTMKAMRLESRSLELSISANRNIRENSERGIAKLSEEHNLMLVEIQTYSMKNQTITKEEHKSLLESRHTLNALISGGVDNWEWYGESLKKAGLTE